MCVTDFDGRRYCSEGCRALARKASCDAARKKYDASIKKDPALLKAVLDKHARREKERRDRIRSAKKDSSPCVPEQSIEPVDSCFKIESSGEVAPSVPAAGLEKPETPGPVPGVPRSTDRERTLGTSGPSLFISRCCVCGMPGRVRWRLPRDAGTALSDRQRVHAEEDP